MTFSLDGDRLVLTDQISWSSFDGLDKFLTSPGPWIAGLDFPFGQPRRLVESLGWPPNREDYVAEVGRLGPKAFQDELETFKAARPAGQKEYRSQTDIAASSISPMKFYGVPVGKMFAHGAPRLIQADVTVPGLRLGDPDRIVIEAYPGVAVRSLVGKRPHKSDDRRSRPRRAIKQGRKSPLCCATGKTTSAFGSMCQTMPSATRQATGSIPSFVPHRLHGRGNSGGQAMVCRPERTVWRVGLLIRH